MACAEIDAETALGENVEPYDEIVWRIELGKPTEAFCKVGPIHEMDGAAEYRDLYGFRPRRVKHHVIYRSGAKDMSEPVADA